MRTLKEYLFEGIFDTPEDAVPVELIYNQLENRNNFEFDFYTSPKDIRKYIDIIDGKCVFTDMYLEKDKEFLYIKQQLPEFIKFNEEQWLSNNINADIRYNVKSQKDLNNIRFINCISKLDKNCKELSINCLSDSLYITYGTPGVVKKLDINFSNNDIMIYHVFLDNVFDINDFNKISINSSVLGGIKITSSKNGISRKYYGDLSNLINDIDEYYNDNKLHVLEEKTDTIKKFINWAKSRVCYLWIYNYDGNMSFSYELNFENNKWTIRKRKISLKAF